MKQIALILRVDLIGREADLRGTGGNSPAGASALELQHLPSLQQNQPPHQTLCSPNLQEGMAIPYNRSPCIMHIYIYVHRCVCTHLYTQVYSCTYPVGSMSLENLTNTKVGMRKMFLKLMTLMLAFVLFCFYLTSK